MTSSVEILNEIDGRRVGTNASGDLVINHPAGSRSVLGAGAAGLVKVAMPALPRYRTALAATLAGSADTRIAFGPGDSKTVGAYASGVAFAGCRPLSPSAAFTKLLRAQGLTVSDDNSFGVGQAGAGGTLYNGYDPRISATTVNWSDSSALWLGGNMIYSATNEASTVKYAFDLPFNVVDIYVFQSGSGSLLDVSVDGGTVIQTINTNGALAVVKYTVTIPGPETRHVLWLSRRATPTGIVPIAGVMARSTNQARVHVMNWGITGVTSQGYADNTNSTYSPFAGIALVQPHLAISDLGTNDFLNGVAPSVTVTSMQALGDQVNAAGGDFVGIVTAPVATGSASAAAQRAQAFALRPLFQQNGWPIVDARALYGDFTSAAAAGFFFPANDPIHPGAAGYAAVAALCAAVPGISSAVAP